MNTDSFPIKLKELPFSTLLATVITSKIFLLTLSLIARESRWIFSYVLATIVGLTLLHLITKLLPNCYYLEITSQGIKYITVFNKIRIPWEDFQYARVEWDSVYGKNACIYNSSQRLKIRFIGAIALNCARVSDLLNLLKQNYQEGKLKNDTDLQLLMTNYLASSKKEIQSLLDTFMILINNATKLNSIVSINKDWFILRFGDFPLRFFSILLLFITLCLIPMQMFSAYYQEHNLWKFYCYVVLLLVVVCLVFLAFIVRNNVFYNDNTHEAYRILSIFKYYYLKGGKVSSVTTIEIIKSTTTKNTYGVFLKNAFDRILCKGYLLVTQSRHLAKKISEAIHLPINDPIAKKLTSNLTLFLDFCNFFTMIMLPIIIILLYNKLLINIAINAVKAMAA